MYISKYLILSIAPLLFSCQNDWLDAKPSKSLVVPQTTNDFQAILDNTDLFNMGHPALGELSADNHYLTLEVWQAGRTMLEKNCYIWADDIYNGETRNGDWNNAFERVLTANVILKGIEKLESEGGRSKESKRIRGSVLFRRALDFYNLTQVFCSPYSENTASSDLGLPLRLSPDVNKKEKRASLLDTYNKIIYDVKTSCFLLPDTALYKTRPSRSAAYALLARIYLSMQDYSNALLYADSALQIKDELVNYTSLTPSATYPMPLFNGEVIYHYALLPLSLNSSNRFNMDTALYESYEESDLRKTLWFRQEAGEVKFRGSYTGSRLLFGGLAVDELYLIRAEAYAWLGDLNSAMDNLNALLVNRWKPGAFVPFVASGPEDALEIILKERRKALVFRGVRWGDLKRLNQHPEYAVTLHRKLNGKTYSLEPGSSKYLLPIPPTEIHLK